MTVFRNAIDAIANFSYQVGGGIKEGVMELFGTQQSPKQPSTEEVVLSRLQLLNPDSLEDARSILGLSEQETRDVNVINEKYRSLTELLEEKEKKLSPVFSKSIQALLETTHKAHKTIMNHLTVPS